MAKQHNREDVEWSSALHGLSVPGWDLIYDTMPQKDRDRIALPNENQPQPQPQQPQPQQAQPQQPAVANRPRVRRNEIANYMACRYMSGNEAAWLLNGWPLHKLWPPVRPLPVHLKDQQQVRWIDNEEFANMSLWEKEALLAQKARDATSMFLEWMNVNKEELLNPPPANLRQEEWTNWED